MQPAPGTLTLRRIFGAWWPLAASWLLMGLELPAVSAGIARLPDARIHLAAYGGVVSPMSMLIEAPIIMLLAASTALSRDWASYALIRRFMMRLGGALTLLHALVAFTPLYHVLANDILGVPKEIQGPAQIGLMIMTPWTWSIAYRRFHQGVLIRFGRSGVVGTGTLVRLGAEIAVVATGLIIHTIPGIIVGSAAVIAGVAGEAAFVGFMVRPVLKNELRQAPPVEKPLLFRDFLHFYIPLAMTSLLNFLAMPLGSAAMSRMPRPLDSLAVWPVLSGLVFMLRSIGYALNEVVVALLDEPGAIAALRRFSLRLGAVTTLAIIVVAVTPLGRFWLSTISALPDSLTHIGAIGLWLAIPLPAFSVVQSYYQGTLVHSRETRAITQAVVGYLLVSALVLAAGVLSGRTTGLYVSVLSMVIGSAALAAWLWFRARRAIKFLEGRRRGDEPLALAVTPGL